MYWLSYMERNVTFVVLPINPGKVLLPGLGTMAVNESFGAALQAASMFPDHEGPGIDCSINKGAEAVFSEVKIFVP